jgi:hypothetical protein
MTMYPLTEKANTFSFENIGNIENTILKGRLSVFSLLSHE